MPILPDIDIEKADFPIDSAVKKLDKALRYLNFAKTIESLEGGEESKYNMIYDAARISCEAILLAFGHRVKKSNSAYHYKVIDFANQLMDGRLKNEFIRIQKMRKKRNELEYGDFGRISKQELEQAYLDVMALAEAVRKLIDEKHPNTKISFPQ